MDTKGPLERASAPMTSVASGPASASVPDEGYGATFRLMMEHMPGVVYVEINEPGYRARYVSPRIQDVLGYPPERFTADDSFWAGIVHPDDLPHVLSLEKSGASEHLPFSAEYRMRDASGGWHWFLDEAIYVDPCDGEHGWWQGILTDVTQQKDRERELIRAAAQFEATVSKLPAVVYIEDADCDEMLYISPRYEQWFGHTAQERMSDPGLWKRLLHPDDREAAIAHSQVVEAAGAPYAADYRMVGRDGTVRWIQDEANLVTEDDGTPMFWLGVMLDITERKTIEQELTRALELEQHAVRQLRQADHMKNTFLTAVSHDLRTPLTAILGSAITLEQEDELGLSSEDRRALIRAVAEKARKLTRLVNDLLDMERLTRGLAEPDLEHTDLGPVVARLVEESDLSRDGRSLHVSCGSVEALVDVSLIDRIVENLLTNAAKHAPDGADVWVRLEQADGGALLAVEDDGPGVPMEMGRSLFRPFERGPSANPQSPGVGVGLSLVARFAELHGGRAWVEDRVGGGASFRVWLPGAG